MRAWWLGSLAAVVCVVLLWWLSLGDQPTQVTDMPWQVSVDAQGRSTVFGVTLGETRLMQAVDKFGREAEVAAFSGGDQGARVEGYFHNIELGPVIAKVVVTLKADQAQIEGMMEQASKQAPTPSGAVRFTPGQADMQVVKDMIIESITYLPTFISLDEAMVLARFGEPARRVAMDKGRVHFLYPNKGLDVMVDPEGKEVMQYLLPGNFAQLEEKLLAAKQELDESVNPSAESKP